MASIAAIVVLMRLQTANTVSADYDKIEGFFEDLESYLQKLKILETHVSVLPELTESIMKVFSAILVLCGICAKQASTRRYGESSCLCSRAGYLYRRQRQSELSLGWRQ